jgi:hypothetical protein
MATMEDIVIDKPPLWALYPNDTDCLEVRFYIFSRFIYKKCS